MLALAIQASLDARVGGAQPQGGVGKPQAGEREQPAAAAEDATPANVAGEGGDGSVAHEGAAVGVAGDGGEAAGGGGAALDDVDGDILDAAIRLSMAEPLGADAAAAGMAEQLGAEAAAACDAAAGDSAAGDVKPPPVESQEAS